MFEMLLGGKSRKKKDKRKNNCINTLRLRAYPQISRYIPLKNNNNINSCNIFLFAASLFSNEASACAFMATATNTCALLIRSTPTSFCKKTRFLSSKIFRSLTTKMTFNVKRGLLHFSSNLHARTSHSFKLNGCAKICQKCTGSDHYQIGT